MTAEKIAKILSDASNEATEMVHAHVDRVKIAFWRGQQAAIINLSKAFGAHACKNEEGAAHHTTSASTPLKINLRCSVCPIVTKKCPSTGAEMTASLSKGFPCEGKF